MELYYKHNTRTIVDEKNNVLTITQARAAVENGDVKDMNAAMVTLINHGYDMEAVADYYRDCA